MGEFPTKEKGEYHSMKQSNLENSLYQNAAMGTYAIRQVLPKVSDGELKKELNKQLNMYHNESNAVASSMRGNSNVPQRLPVMKRVMSKAGIAFELARDNSSEHIAEMMIQGTNMGIIDINRALNGTKNLSPQAAKQAKEMLSREQQYIDSLKRFL